VIGPPPLLWSSRDPERGNFLPSDELTAHVGYEEGQSAPPGQFNRRNGASTMPPRRARRTFKYKSTTKISRPPCNQKGPKWQHFTLPAARLSRHYRGSLFALPFSCLRFKSYPRNQNPEYIQYFAPRLARGLMLPKIQDNNRSTKSFDLRSRRRPRSFGDWLPPELRAPGRRRVI